MSDEFVVYDSPDGKPGPVVYRGPTGYNLPPAPEPSFPDRPWEAGLTQRELERMRRMGDDSRDTARRLGQRMVSTFATNIRANGQLIRADDHSVTDEQLARQIHIWEMEDSLGMERSSPTYWDDLEQEPPTLDDLRLMRRQRADATAALAVTHHRKTVKRAFAVACIAPFILMGCALLFLSVL